MLASRAQILTAGFVAGPIAGSWLLARNFRVRGQNRAWWQAIVAGIVFISAFLVVAMLAPTDTPRWLFWLITVLILNCWLYFGSAPQPHDSEQTSSWWRVTGVCAVTLAWSIPLIIFCLVFVPIMPVNSHTTGNHTIFFEGYATRADAIDLTRDLQRQGVFNRYDSWGIVLRFPSDRPGAVELELWYPFATRRSSQQLLRAFQPVVDHLASDFYAPKTVEMHVINLIDIKYGPIRGR